MCDNSEPIAVIGMGCRLPGEGDTLEGFWDMIRSGRSAHSDIPPERFNADAWYHPNPDRKGAVITKSGYFLKENVSLFDAPFFSITVREAQTMDPMHRLMLEVAYESLENAGIPISKIAGTDTGCFVGSFTHDFDQMTGADIYSVAPYAATGGGATMLSNRVSWFYDLRGPSFSVDTACSSGITALHIACQSIKQGDATTCIVGGTNLLIYPELFQALSRMRMISPDGKCHTFDARANGYARGEGVASLVIKRLSAAIADGDTIRAVIRNTGANQDGRTPGITMPSAHAQMDLIKSTYAKAGLSLRETGFFEAHGTGTPIGDPLELSSLGATFGSSKLPDDPPLYVSSVKTNVGHTEGCSAIAGIIKAILCLEKGQIGPNADFESLNPRLRLDEWRLAIPPKTISWPALGVRRVSVNSFGYGGANGHVILDDAHSYLHAHGLQGNDSTVTSTETESSEHDSGISDTSSTQNEPAYAASQRKLFVFSAADQAGIARVAQKYLQFLQKRIQQEESAEHAGRLDEKLYAENLAYTLASRRSLFDYRTFAVGDSLRDLRTYMEAGLPNIPRTSTQNNLFFVFTGQGAQWPAMGRELLTEPVFRSSFDQSQHILEELGCRWKMARCLEHGDKKIDRPEFSQTICTAVQLALLSLLESWGATPQAVVGHSSGEIAAAFAAKVISQADAMRIAYTRGLLSEKVSERMKEVSGSMLAAGISENEASQYLGQLSSGKAVVACINSPTSVTLSGDTAAIEQLEKALNENGKFARKLKVQTAYHSHHMNAISDDYMKALKSVRTLAPPKDAPRMFSSVTGELIESKNLDGPYWVRNMVSPVKFSHAVQSLLQFSVRVRGRRKTIEYTAAVEIGPHEALKGPLQQIMVSVNQKLISSVTYTSLLSRGSNAESTAMAAAGTLWARGVEVDLAKVNHQIDERNYKVLEDLPAYPWNHRKEFWHEPEMIKAMRHRKYPRTDLLGTPFDPQNPLRPSWRNFLSVAENPWLEQHKIQGSTLYPAAGMLIMALEAAHQMHREAGSSRTMKGVEFKNVDFRRGLVVPQGDASIETNLHVSPQRLGSQNIDGWFDFTLFSMASSDSWTEHASGQFSLVYTKDAENALSGRDMDWQAKLRELKHVEKIASMNVDTKIFYRQLSDVGLAYGDQFRNVTKAYAGVNCAYGTIEIPDTKKLMPYEYEFPHFIHPATLDAIFHLSFIGTTSGGPLPSASVPIRLESMFIASDLPHGAGTPYRVYTWGEMKGIRERSSSFVISDVELSEPKIVVKNFSSRDMENAPTVSPSQGTTSLYNSQFTGLHWIKDADIAPDSSSQLKEWLMLKTRKSSSLSVLFLNGAAQGDIIHNFAPRPGFRSRFGHCVISEDSKETLEALQSNFETDGIVAEYKTVTAGDAGHETPSGGPFDIIIASSSHFAPEYLEARLKQLRNDVKPGGNIVLLEGSDAAPQGSDQSLRSTLETARFGFTRFQSGWALATAPTDQTPRFGADNIVLLTPADMSPAVKDLATALIKKARVKGIKAKCAGLSEIDKVEGQTIISLLEIQDALVLNMDKGTFQCLQKLFVSVPYILWLGLDALDNGASIGFFRTIRSEYPQLRLPCLNFSPSGKLDADVAVQSILTVLEATNGPGDERIDLEYRDQSGIIMLPRLITNIHFDSETESTREDPTPSLQPLYQENRAVKATVHHPGDLETIIWVQDDEQQDLAPHDVEIKVESVAMHPSDLDVALGSTRLSDLGSEATGTVLRIGSSVPHISVGSRVAMMKTGACRTVLRQHADFVQPLPVTFRTDEHSFIPSAYIAAYHALFNLARLTSGEKVLIHGAGGSTGQAAVQLARSVSADIFVTITSEEDRRVMEHQLGVPKHHIFNYDDSSIARTLVLHTSDEGVDVILNVGPGKELRRLLDCVAVAGRVINLGAESSNIVLDSAKQLTYSCFALDTMLSTQLRMVSKVFRKVSELLRSQDIGFLDGIPKHSVSELPKALPSLQAGSQLSAIVFEMRPEACVPMLPPKPTQLVLDPEAAYVLCGGLGALGLSLSDDMVECGARHLVFLSRSGAVTELQKAHIRKWESWGCKITDVRCDTTDSAQVQAFSGRAEKDGWKIKGVVQMAMVLRDSPFSTMTHEQWRTGLLPKTLGTWNLHAYLPDNMDFFITLSSISNIIGNGAQAQYAAGNAYQDSLAFYRRSLGMAAVSIGLGVMHDVKNNHMPPEETEKWLARNPTLLPLKFTEQDFLTTIKAIMRGTTSDGVPVPPYIVCGVKNDMVRDDAARVTHKWVFDAKMEMRVKQPVELGANNAASSGRVLLAEELKSVPTAQKAIQLVEEAIRRNLAAAMGAEPQDIDTQKPLHASGVDSLKAVEFRSWVLSEIKADVSVFDILSSKPLATLAAQIAGNSSLISPQIAKNALEAMNE